MNQWTIREAISPDDIEDARTLFREYHSWLGEVVCSSRLAEEIAELPGPYAPPAGVLLVAHDTNRAPVGIVGVRPHHKESCEMKRLYVRVCARGAGLGEALARGAIDSARALGYRRALLTSLPGTMATAIGLYRRLGFVETERFYDHSHVADEVEIIFMERDLMNSVSSDGRV